MKDQIKEIIGRTWFSFEEDRETYFLRSREYGDVCEEEPGKQDIEEAKRLIGLLRKAGHKVSGDVVDEWVEVIIRKQNSRPNICGCGAEFIPSYGEHHRCPACLSKEASAAEVATWPEA